MTDPGDMAATEPNAHHAAGTLSPVEATGAVPARIDAAGAAAERRWRTGVPIGWRGPEAAWPRPWEAGRA